jgi:metal iron transporter
MSNFFAIFLQSLCIKLGSVSGLNLAEACKEFLPKWLNISLYIMAEVAVSSLPLCRFDSDKLQIIATDIAEVIGTAIAINLLIPKIPLVAGCALSIVDVLLILFFYKPNGSMKGIRAFEMFVIALVLGVVICFCIQLSLIKGTSVGEVFRGYLPSSAIVQSEGYVALSARQVPAFTDPPQVSIKPVVSLVRLLCLTAFTLVVASCSLVFKSMILMLASYHL